MIQVKLKEYVKIRESIYEVDSKAENGLTFSCLLDVKVMQINLQSFYFIFFG